MNFKILTLVVINICPIILFAQNYRFNRFTTENSDLPQNQVMCLHQDSKGFIWIGTRKGTVRYNEKDFQTFGTAEGVLHGTVDAIHETPKGDILLHFRRAGITKISPNGSVESSPWPEYISQSAPAYLSGDSLIFLAQSETKNGGIRKFLVSFKNKQYNILSELPKHTHHVFRANDTLWVNSISSSHYAVSWLSADFKLHKKIDNARALTHVYSDTLYFIKKGGLLFSYFEGKTSKIIESNESTRFFIGNKTIYARYQNDRLTIEYDLNGKEKDRYYIAKHRLPLIDKEGNTWFDSENGLIMLPNRAFRHYVFEDYGFKPDNPNLIISEEGLWLSASYHQFYLFKNNNFEQMKMEELSASHKLHYTQGRLKKPDGTVLWGGNLGGVLERRQGKFKFRETAGISGIYVLYYDTLTKQTIYGHEEGFSFEDSLGNFTHDPLLRDSMSYVVSVEKDTAGYYWFATRLNIHRFKEGEISRIQEDLFRQGALDIIKDSRHNLWFGGEGGLIFYDNKKFTKIKHPAFKNLAVTALHESRNNILLIGTTSGLLTMDLNTFYDTRRVAMNYYGSNNGFSSYECAQDGFAEDADGNVWIATNDRIVHIDVDKLSRNNVPVVPYIAEVLVLDDSARWQKQNSDKRFFTHSEHNIKFRFSGPYFTQKVFFAYYLEGYEDTWSDYGENREAVYANLPPGKYTFRLKASNGDSSDNLRQASYSFVVEPAFWQTLWFRLLLLSLLVFVVLMVVRRYTKAQKEKLKVQEQRLHISEGLKNELANYLHTDLGSKILPIIYALEEKNKNNYLQAEIEGIRNFYNDIRNKSHLLKMPDFSKTSLYAETENLKLRFKHSDVELKQDFDTSNYLNKLSPKTQLSIYRIIQELINNSLKHSKAKLMEIRLKKKESCLLMEFLDDGKGYNPDEIKYGFGYKHEIAAGATILKADFSDLSKKGIGTHIKFEIPVQKPR